MNTAYLENLTELLETCDQLRDQLEEAREALSDEAWDEMQDGPFGEILCAAMDVEHLIESKFDV